MRITVFQPPYPEAATPQAAAACQAGIRDQLQTIEPGETELVVLPEYANAPGLTERETLLQFARNEGETFVQEVASHAKRHGCGVPTVRIAVGQPHVAVWARRRGDRLVRQNAPHRGGERVGVDCRFGARRHRA